MLRQSQLDLVWVQPLRSIVAFDFLLDPNIEPDRQHATEERENAALNGVKEIVGLFINELFVQLQLHEVITNQFMIRGTEAYGEATELFAPLHWKVCQLETELLGTILEFTPKFFLN